MFFVNSATVIGRIVVFEYRDDLDLPPRLGLFVLVCRSLHALLPSIDSDVSREASAAGAD